MKLCITSMGRHIDDKIDERFGRASYFLIIDTETMEIEPVQNDAQSAEQGAGIKAAQIVRDKGVDAVLTGFLGPKASSALASSKIKIYENASSKDTVKDAIEKFKNRGYTETIHDPSVQRRTGR
ncbi:MAG: NifB/NifX family molybdenum-iron cluster-binding protein [Dissulfurispiraceae bacterium]|jgi:predicted Fe-Mo cluster-binding NifX family protein|nr:NifB/NifX family molybdenum-iron cluster-binding protein [Dissulfurispiraceae bacterium]